MFQSLRSGQWLLTLLALNTVVIAQESGRQAYNEYFSSVAGLETLLRTEQALLLDLKQYVEWTKQQLHALESEVVKIDREHALATADMENYLTNPVNAYRLIKRLHNDWHSYETRVRQDNLSAYFLERMRVSRDTFSFPSQEDADGAAMGLVRLQNTYQLDVAEVAAGVLNGIKYGNGMTWQDCFILGEQLYSLENYNYTKIWLKESMQRLSRELVAKEPMSLEYMTYVAEKLMEIGDLGGALQLSRKVLSINPYHGKAAHTREVAEIALHDKSFEAVEPAQDTWHYHLTEEFKVYEKTCRGDITPTPAQQRPLRCRYVTNDTPYRRISPFKVEEHSLDPLVMTIHDVISDNKIDTIKRMAIPGMHRSTVRTDYINVSSTSDVRVSKTAWLKYDEHRYMLQMLRTVDDLTGLNMTYSEELQVVNYGLGGHYEPHWDFYEQIPDDEGNRIATAIFYLSDVEQGGATVFPYLRIAVHPRKGDMLFWYNLHRSLDKDYRTKHAGCPVLKGSKWIGNVWVRDITQTFTRPCALRRDHETSLQYAMPK